MACSFTVWKSYNQCIKCHCQLKIPTPKELYKLKNNAKNKEQSGRKQGGQSGHKDHTKEKAPADTIVKVELDSLQCECGGKISLFKNCSVHQKIEIPEIKCHCQLKIPH